MVRVGSGTASSYFTSCIRASIHEEESELVMLLLHVSQFLLGVSELLLLLVLAHTGASLAVQVGLAAHVHHSVKQQLHRWLAGWRERDNHVSRELFRFKSDSDSNQIQIQIRFCVSACVWRYERKTDTCWNLHWQRKNTLIFRLISIKLLRICLSFPNK